MLHTVGKERVFRNFLRGSELEFSRFIDIPHVRRRDVASLFRIRNFMKTVQETAHWAAWNAVGEEISLAGGDVRRRVGFKLSVGRDKEGLVLWYFPEIHGRDKHAPVQTASLSVHGPYSNLREDEKISQVEAHIQSVISFGRCIKFMGDIPTKSGIHYPVMFIEPSEEPGQYQFSLGERMVFGEKRRPRRGSADAVALPGFVMQSEETIVEFEEPSGIFFEASCRTQSNRVQYDSLP